MTFLDSATSEPIKLLNIAAWSRTVGLTRQAGHEAVKRCGIALHEGKIDPEEATKAYLEHSRTRAPDSRRIEELSKAAAKPSAGAEARQMPEGSGYFSSRAKKEAAEAQMAELKAAQLAGTLVDKRRVETAVFDAFRVLRDRVMAVPRRCASSVIGMTEQRDIEIAIADELRRALGVSGSDGEAELSAAFTLMRAKF